MKSIVIPIKGMHCRSCELLVEGELQELSGVCQVDVSQKKKQAVIHYEKYAPGNKDIENAVRNAGYEVGIEAAKPWFSRKSEDYLDLFYALFALGILYLVVDIYDFEKLISTNVAQPSNLTTVLIVGLTAGFSTCMALIGGLVLGVSARFSEQQPFASSLSRFKPHIFFNIGRIGAYFILGGILGIAGSVFQLSGFSLGLMTLAVALVMLTLGLQLTNLFPRLEDFKLTLPTGIAKRLGLQEREGQEYSHKNAMTLGALTFFLPCGFTQAMQIYAISTGDFMSGALIMGVFALGTAPGLLGIGGLTAVIKGVFAEKFFKFAGVVVIVLALFNAQNGLNLIGWNPEFSIPQTVTAANTVQVEKEGDVQVIRMEQHGSGYSPNRLTVVKDVPVKWIVNSTNSYTCAASILASKVGIRANLQPGENIFEFTPTEVGIIPFSCSMGMYRGTIEVVSSEKEVTKVEPSTQQVTGEVKNGSQILRSEFTNSNGMIPNEFTVKQNQPVVLEILSKDNGVGCMGTVKIPGIDNKVQLFEAGKTVKYQFTPTKTGTYSITCAMGVPHGEIKVI